MVDPKIFRLMAEALAIGLLVGIERYKDREPGEKKSAGVRTFVVFALLGGVCGLLDQPGFTTATFLAMAGFLLLGYNKYPEESVGLTTEFAALLVFWTCFLLFSYETLAISLAIVLTIFLASKRALHDLVREQISEIELYATLKFLVVVLVVFPILPNRSFGPFDFFNPRQVWGLVILVSTISYVGYFLVRWLGGRRGILASALSGGVVSTTAVTMSLADRARSLPEASRLFAAAAVVANSVQAPRLLLLIWVLSPDLGRALAIPLIGMAVTGMIGSWFVTRRTRDDSAVDFRLDNPYSLRPALRFGAFFVVILFLTKAANQWFGRQGVFVVSAVAGLASTSSGALAVSDLVSSEALAVSTGALAVLLAVFVNALTKWVLTLLNGTREMALWLAGGLLTILTAGAALLLAGGTIPF